MLIHTGSRFFPEWEEEYNNINFLTLGNMDNNVGSVHLLHMSRALQSTAIDMYIADTADNAESVMIDAEQIISAFEKEDFQKEQRLLINYYEELKAEGKNIAEPKPRMNFDSCFKFLRYFLIFQYRAIEDMSGIDITAYYERLYALIYNRVSSFYKPPAAHRPGEPLTNDDNLIGAEFRKIQALEESVIESIGERQLSITSREYMHALTPYRNEAAYIARMSEEFFSKLTFRHDMIDVPGSGLRPIDIKRETAEGLQDIKDLDLPLLREIFTAVYKSAQSATKSTTTVYLPAFCREMGIDMQKSKPNDLFKKIDVFKNCIGVMGTGYWKVLEVLGYDRKTNCLELATPYFNRLIIAQQELAKASEKGRRKSISSGYSRLIHSTIVKERNKVAVEIVQFIVTGLVQRGALPDGKLEQNKNRQLKRPDIVTYSASFKTIVEHVPELEIRLRESSAADKNKQLARAFKKAYEILKTQTDLYEHFIELNIPEVIPTTSTLNTLLQIEHKGINGDFRPPTML